MLENPFSVRLFIRNCCGNVKQEVKIPRNSSGTYSLPIAAFVPGGLIKSSDHNSNYSDIATALTQSLATTGVSTMTGPIKAAAGAVSAPGMTFTGALTTGFYLAGTNQIGWTSNGVQGATFNNDTSVTWAGGATWGGNGSFSGTLTVGGVVTQGSIPIGAVMDFAGATPPAKWLLCYGQLVSTTTYSLLFAQLSTTYGSGAGTFGIPDYRGRATFGQDNMGGSAANRITATVNFDGTVLGNSGGVQSNTLITGNLPAYTPAGSVAVNATLLSGNSGSGFNSGGAYPSPSAGTGSFTGTPQGGTSTAFSNLSPAIISNKVIYAGV
jgi:microcystin-dependent protein